MRPDSRMRIFCASYCSLVLKCEIRSMTMSLWKTIVSSSTMTSSEARLNTSSRMCWRRT